MRKRAPQLARKAPVLRTYIIRLNVAAFVTFRPRAGRNRINVRTELTELIDGVRDGKLTNYSLREDD
jgi:hypothetical protein